MHTVTTSFLKDIFGSEAIKSNKMMPQKFEQVLYLFKGKYPSSKLGNDSLTMAITAIEFVLNAEVYFTEISSKHGKAFFDLNKIEFLKHFDYGGIMETIKRGDKMLLLYKPLSEGKRKLSAHGVIGKFHSIEQEFNNDIKSVVVVLKLEISNNGIIDLPITDMAYFGRWSRKLEIIM